MLIAAGDEGTRGIIFFWMKRPGMGRCKTSFITFALSEDGEIVFSVSPGSTSTCRAEVYNEGWFHPCFKKSDTFLWQVCYRKQVILFTSYIDIVSFSWLGYSYFPLLRHSGYGGNDKPSAGLQDQKLHELLKPESWVSWFIWFAFIPQCLYISWFEVNTL